MSLRKTGLLWIVLLLPVWGWASSVHTESTAVASLKNIQERRDSRSQKRQDDRKKRKKPAQKQERDQKRKPDQKPEAEQKQKADRVQRPDDRDRVKEGAGRHGEKPQIKEVPKSIHKLKPKSVTEKVRIRRPPVKVKPKGLFRVY